MSAAAEVHMCISEEGEDEDGEGGDDKYEYDYGGIELMVEDDKSKVTVAVSPGAEPRPCHSLVGQERAWLHSVQSMAPAIPLPSACLVATTPCLALRASTSGACRVAEIFSCASDSGKLACARFVLGKVVEQEGLLRANPHGKLLRPRNGSRDADLRCKSPTSTAPWTVSRCPAFSAVHFGKQRLAAQESSTVFEEAEISRIFGSGSAITAGRAGNAAKGSAAR